MNSNQYLRPEDLPVMDAKKSPLALLAQTCSNIGVDLIGGGKPLRLPSSSNPNSSTRDQDGAKSSSKRKSSLVVDGGLMINCHSRSDSASSDKTLANSIDRSPCSSSANSTSSTTVSPNHQHIGQVSAHATLNHNVISTSRSSTGRQTLSPSSTPNTNNNNNNVSSNKISFKPYESCSSPKRSASTSGTSSNNNNHEHNSAKKQRHSPTSTKVNGHSSDNHAQQQSNNKTDGDSVSSDKSTTHNSTSSASTTPTITNGFPANYPMSFDSKFSPFASYHQAQLAAQMAQLGKPVCADPFCRGCQMTIATGVPSPIPCANSLAAAAAGYGGHGFPPGLGLHPSLASLGAAAAASRYPPTSLANSISGLNRPGRPFVCSWTAGGAYCGKIFGTSEELLQHLKSHTVNFNASNAAASAALNQNNLAAAAAAAAAYGQSLTSPMAGLRRTQALNRFHPYNKSPFGPPTGAHLGSLSHMMGAEALASSAMNHQAMAASLGLGNGYPTPGSYDPYALARAGLPPIPP